MRTEIQPNSELSQLCSLIAEMDVAMLTSTDEKGALSSRPMRPLEMDRFGALWFFIDLHAINAKQLDTVNLSFVDAEHEKYISIAGWGELIRDQERIRKLWTPIAKPWFPDGPRSSNLALLRVTPCTAEYWEASLSKIVRRFAMAASIAAGKPIGLGEHEALTNLHTQGCA